MTRIKICGVTSVEQAVACVELGADAVGVNFVLGSPRRVDVSTGAAISGALGERALVVAVVAGLTVAQMRSLRDATGVGCLQLHGGETAEDVTALLPHAYKAVGIAGASDVAVAAAMPGEYVMVDAKPALSSAPAGGTGTTFDWSLVVDLAARRRVVLAGGLRADNVAAAIARVAPWCVDVASGVESAPGIKDLVKVKAFIDAVRRSSRTHSPTT